MIPMWFYHIKHYTSSIKHVIHLYFFFHSTFSTQKIVESFCSLPIQRNDTLSVKMFRTNCWKFNEITHVHAYTQWIWEGDPLLLYINIFFGVFLFTGTSMLNLPIVFSRCVFFLILTKEIKYMILCKSPWISAVIYIIIFIDVGN